MALKISKNSGLTDVAAEGNPITTTHINTGEAKVVQLWIFNDNAAKRYESITVDPIDTSGADESGYVQLSIDGVTYGAAGAPLSIPNISTANVGTTFYYRVTTPSLADSQNKTDIALQIDALEFAV